MVLRGVIRALIFLFGIICRRWFVFEYSKECEMKINKTIMVVFFAILIVVLLGFGLGVDWIPALILALLQLFLFVCLFFLPTIILGLIMRHPPIYRRVWHNRFVRVMVVLGNGLLCLGLAYLMFTWAATVLSYDIAKPDPASGITRADMEQFKSAVFNEMWLRQIIPGVQSQTCFSGKAIVCQIADVVSNIGFSWFIFLGAAFLPTLFNLLLGWKYTREPDGSKAG
jgi:hypothetical protein